MYVMLQNVKSKRPGGRRVVEVEERSDLLEADVLQQRSQRKRLPQRSHGEVSDLELDLGRVLRDAQLQRYCTCRSGREICVFLHSTHHIDQVGNVFLSSG